MANIYKTYKLIEGVTRSNCYGALELRLDITQYPKENKSTVKAYLYLVGKNYNTVEEADGTRIRLELYGNGGLFTIHQEREGVTYKYGHFEKENSQILVGNKDYSSSNLGSDNYLKESYKLWVEPEETSELYFYTATFTVNHELDGTCRLDFGGSLEGIVDYSDESIKTDYTINNSYITVDLPPIERAVIPVTATNFTDEENPVISYDAITGKSNAYYLKDNKRLYATARADTITSLQAGLSFDGVTLDVAYRDIPIGVTSYTFELTDEEREILRQKAQGAATVPIYYMTKTIRNIHYLSEYFWDYDSEYDETAEFLGKTQRMITIVSCNPSLNSTVKDIKPETLALTGDENTFIRYESMAEYAINATPSKHATILTQSVQCGNKIINDLPYGVIDDVESGTFIFSIVDSRQMGAVSTVSKNLIEYVKPTCYQKLVMEMSGEFDTRVVITVEGNYYSGSFGAVDNTLQLEVRYSEGNGSYGDWIALEGTPTYNGTTYSLQATLEGFSYSKAYTFQCRATDKLNSAISSNYTLRIYPVFDWGENDFNFNVPVNINADNLTMHDETIIRHSAETNNTVLSATGGHVYIRPGGTSDTSGQTIMYSDGRVDFSGTVNFGNSFSIEGNTLADYIIETGEEAMGSNGTWYWAKWASGKAECWGCRNFGNTAVTTSWGGLYRSAIFTQDLPEKVFKTTPDVITMNVVNSNFGGWICKHENAAPSAVTTGSFIFVRPASATVTPLYIGFHVIGVW